MLLDPAQHILKKMESTPQQLKDLAQSALLYDQSERIGAKFNLHIDQIGELDAEIRGILLGSLKSSNFVADIKEHLEISREIAEQIVDEVNKAVFQTMKASMQSQQSANESKSISSIEKAGGFTVEQEKKENHVPDNLPTQENMISSLENPLPGKRTTFPKAQETHTDPIIDHLLGTSEAQAEEKIVQTPKLIPKAPEMPKKAAGPDPYRDNA